MGSWWLFLLYPYEDEDEDGNFYSRIGFQQKDLLQKKEFNSKKDIDRELTVSQNNTQPTPRIKLRTLSFLYLKYG
jgi:hypothetical protein